MYVINLGFGCQEPEIWYYTYSLLSPFFFPLTTMFGNAFP